MPPSITAGIPGKNNALPQYQLKFSRFEFFVKIFHLPSEVTFLLELFFNHTNGMKSGRMIPIETFPNDL
jgi:hypothetical protein